MEQDPRSLLAWLANVDESHLRDFLALHWRAEDALVSRERLDAHAKACVLPAAKARRAAARKRADIPVLVDELVSSGIVPSKEKAFEQLAQGGPGRPAVNPKTIANAYYRLRPRVRDRV